MLQGESEMKVQSVDLHGLSVAEAIEKTIKNLDYCIAHGVEVIDLNHGKGHHSNRNFSVVKQSLRKMLKEYPLHESGYRLIIGESNFPIALTFDEGHTLIVARGKEVQYLGGQKQQEKNRVVFSDEGKKERKQAKQQNHLKNRRHRPE
jgi:hypothetical protein